MVIIIRHDVDNPFNIHILNYIHFKFPHLSHLPFYLEAESMMARMEKLHQVRATYFFRPKFTIPSQKLLDELRDEEMFEIALHSDERNLASQKKKLEKATQRRIYGASGHGSSFGILAPTSLNKAVTIEQLKEANLQYHCDFIEGETIIVDRIFRGHHQTLTLESLLQKIMRHKELDSEPLSLLIHCTYLFGYGLYGGYGVYLPIRRKVKSLFKFIHDHNITTLTYHQYMQKYAKVCKKVLRH